MLLPTLSPQDTSASGFAKANGGPAPASAPVNPPADTLSADQYKMTPEEEAGGVAGQKAYYARLTALRNSAGLETGMQGSNPLIKPPTGPQAVVTSGPVVNPDNQQKVEDATKSNEEIAKLTRDKAIADLKASLTPAGGAPKAPNYAEDYTKLRNEQGVADIETNLANLKAEKATIQQDLDKFKQTEGIGNSEGFGVRRMSEAERNAQYRMNALNIQETNLTDQLNYKNNYISTSMDLEGKTFADASKSFNDEFSRNLDAQQLYNTQATKEENQASAYLNSVKDMITSSGKSWSDITPSMKSQIQSAELKAGWAPGTLEAFATAKPNTKVLATVTGSDPKTGEKTVTFIYQNPDGSPGMVKTVNTGVQSETTGGIAGNLSISNDAIDFFSKTALAGVSLNTLVPAFGMGNAAVAAKSKFFEGIYNQAKTLGIDGYTFAAMLTDSKAKQATYSQLQKQGSLNQVNEQKALKDFELVKSLGQTLDKKSLEVAIPALNNWIRTGEVAVTGNPAVNNYLGALTTTLTAYAKVVAGQTGQAGITEFANREAQNLISKGLSTEAVNSYIDNVAKPEMSNTISSYNDALKGLFGNIQNVTDTGGGLNGGVTMPKEGDTHDYNGVTYVVSNGKWVPKLQ